MKIFNFFILGRAPTGRATAGYHNLLMVTLIPISLCIHDDSLFVLGLENDQIIIKKYKIEGTDL
jgi:hypothetical protein